MEHPAFDLEEWTNRLSAHILKSYKDQRLSGEAVTSPLHLLRNLELRRRLGDTVKWGTAVPVDVFVWGVGEPPKPYLTKIAGTPYRPADKAWPTDSFGREMSFLGQICFADSLDLVDEVPGDVMLIFAQQDDWEVLKVEWQNIEGELWGPDYLPEPVQIASCYGLICRTESYPDATLGPELQRVRETPPRMVGDQLWIDRYVDEEGFGLDGEEHAMQLQATQIGRVSYPKDRGWDMPGKPIAALSSIHPVQLAPYPFVNREEPMDLGERLPHALMLGDVGCMYFSLDEDQRVHSQMVYS